MIIGEIYQSSEFGILLVTGEGVHRSSWGFQWKEQGESTANYQIDGG